MEYMEIKNYLVNKIIQLHSQLHSDNRMRGVQVNNYFNNHIIINGKKISNQANIIQQNQRPKPLIINHIHPQIQHEPLLLGQSKSPTMKQITSAQRRKRTNTLVESKHKQGKKRSISLERLKKGLSSKKKQASSSQSEREDYKHTNNSRKKLKPVYTKNEGLWKRSKSTIIKSSHINSEYANHQHHHEIISKQKDGKKSNANNTNESIKQKNEKKSQKKKKKQTGLTPKVSKTLTKQPSAMIKDKQRSFKKDKQFLLKFDKSGDKKSARTIGKSGGTSSKNSKPVSAREKHTKKKLFLTKQEHRPNLFDDLKQKYQNQDILKNINYINSRQEVKEKQEKFKFKRIQSQEQKALNIKKVVSNLQKMLSGVGSKKKLKKQLAIIEQKLKVFHQLKQSEQQQSQEDSQDNKDIRPVVEQHHNKFKKIKIKDLKSEEDVEEITLNNRYGNSNQIESSIKKYQEFSAQYIESFDQNNVIQDENQFNEFNNKSKNNEQSLPKDDVEEVSEDKIYLRIQGENIKNPILDRRFNNNLFSIDLDTKEEYGSEESQKSERKKEIQLLKKFKNQSNKMMEKIGLQKKQALEAQALKQKSQLAKIKQQEHKNYEIPQIQRQQIKSKINSDAILLDIKQPIQKLDVGKLVIITGRDDHYPPSTTLLRSPKFNEQELMGMISLKQKCITNKHEKMNELVHKMYEKQLVSPKSFDFQMYQLRKKYQEDNQHLDYAKRQAEQLSSILSDIRKDKEQIQGIDEMLRNQKWEEARKFIQKSDKKYNNDDSWQRIEIGMDNNINLETLHVNQFDQKQEIINRPRHNKEVRIQFENNKTQESEQYNGYINNYYSSEEQKQQKNQKRALKEKKLIKQKDLKDLKQKEKQKEKAKAKEKQKNNNKQQNSEDQCIYYDGEDEQKEEENNQLIKPQRGQGLIKLIQIQAQNQDNEKQEEVGQNNDEVVNKNQTVIKINSDQDNLALEQSNDKIAKFLNNISGVSSQSSVKERKGFQSNLYFIKEYCIALCEFVRDNDNHKEYFKINITAMTSFDLQELLKSMRDAEYDDFNYVGIKRVAQKSAISDQIFLNFNQTYEALKYSKISSSDQKYKLQKQQQAIFLKSIYDALNQSLNYERPGSIHGRPLPWHNDAKHLKNMKYKTMGLLAEQGDQNTESYDLIFGVAIARIIQWGSCLCGFLPDTIQLENTQIDQQYVNHIRQTRMAFLLQKMMAEEEELMANMQLEELEVEIKLADCIYREIANECAAEINQIMSSRYI